MLKTPASGVPQGYASVAELPAALLSGLFEHPARASSLVPEVLSIEVPLRSNGSS